MELPSGSFHFLTGPSGAGKTTLLRLCALDLLPQSGSVEVFETPSSQLNRDETAKMRRRIGVVQQQTRFIDHLSIFENVLLPVIASGQASRSDHDNVSELLDWVGLGERQNDLPAELSGGEQQRVALARALILSPEIIIADEPTGNVDLEMGKTLMTLLYQLNSVGRTVLIATHDLNIIRHSRHHIQAQILRLDRGQITPAGTSL